MAAACSRSVPPLPLVQTSAFLPAIRTDIDAAYQRARSNPQDAHATGALCKLLDAHDQAEAAAQCYTRASALDPSNFEWQYHLGIVRTAQGRHEDGVAAFRVALRLRTYRPGALRLAEALREAGNKDESFRAFERLIAEEPSNAEAWYGLGRANESRGDVKAAVDCFRKACELYPNYGAAQYALALTLQRQGRAEEAREHFAMAEAHKTDAPASDDSLRAEVRELSGGTNVLLRRAAEFEKIGRVEDAVRENLAALEKDPKLLQARINLVSLYGRSGRMQQAEEQYRAALLLPGSKADAEYNYGVLMFGVSRPTEAERAFRSALASNPQHAQAHHNLGFLLEQEGREVDALAEYEAAIASQADYRLAHFHAGRLLASQRRYAAAIDHLVKTVEPVDDSTPGYLYALSAACARSGQFQRAIAYGQRARDEAAARGQKQLLASIDRDLQLMKSRGTGR